MKKTLLVTCALMGCLSVSAQYSTRTISKLIDDTDYKYIVGETSGERAKNNISDMAGYELYNRNFENLHESEYLFGKLKEYGLKGAEINRYKRDSKVWVAVEGNIWQTSPSIKKLADIGDIPPALAANSSDADVTADLIWVGNATEKELEGLDLKGKIAVGDITVSRLHSASVAKGAVGVISIYNPRPMVDPIQISNSGVNAKLAKETNSFGFQISPREGQSLISSLKRGAKISVRAVVKTKEVAIESQSPSCFIEGSDPNGGEIIFSAHLFEGYTKLGANDNMSGSVVLLEVARTLNTLIEKGIIERPKRTIRFIWGDEFTGIIPWANENDQIMDRSLFNINLDMVGISLAKQKSYYHLHRTTMANSHYVNDLVENMYRYVGITNQNSIIAGSFTDPVIAPTGSDDPFYYSLTEHFGNSDHEIFNDWGIQVPGIMMITWPDEKYHTSADRLDEIDATQVKRASVIAASVAYMAATADEDMAVKIGAEVAGNSLRRIATQHNRVSMELNVAKELNEALKNALYQIDAVAIAEKMGLESIKELAPNSKKLSGYIADQSEIVDAHAEAAKKSLISAVTAKGGETKIVVTSLEKKASKLYPKSTRKVRDLGFGALRQSFTEKYGNKYYSKLSEYKIADSGEAARLTQHGDKSILDIYKMILAQTTRPVELQALIDFMYELEAQGLVEVK